LLSLCFFLYVNLLYLCFLFRPSNHLSGIFLLPNSQVQHYSWSENNCCWHTTFEKFIENEQHASDLGREIHDLKQDLERAQSSSHDLATQLKELTEALKSSQNEKKFVDVARHNLKKEHDKLKEAWINDVQIIEDLRKSIDEGTAAITDLHRTNAKLLKQHSDLVGEVSARDTRIVELEKMVDERDDMLNRGDKKMFSAFIRKIR
jgi:chromosome segregation ATPase